MHCIFVGLLKPVYKNNAAARDLYKCYFGFAVEKGVSLLHGK